MGFSRSCCLWRTGLPQRMRAGEGILAHAKLGDPAYRRKRREVAFEEMSSDRLTRQANISDGDGIPLAVAAGLAALSEIDFERAQSLADPVLNPFQTGGLVKLELVLQVFAHAWHQQRMRVAGDYLRQPAHARACARRGRQ